MNQRLSTQNSQISMKQIWSKNPHLEKPIHLNTSFRLSDTYPFVFTSRSFNISSQIFSLLTVFRLYISHCQVETSPSLSLSLSFVLQNIIYYLLPIAFSLLTPPHWRPQGLLFASLLWFQLYRVFFYSTVSF